jgi:hypothetical protein
VGAVTTIVVDTVLPEGFGSDPPFELQFPDAQTASPGMGTMVTASLVEHHEDKFVFVKPTA